MALLPITDETWERLTERYMNGKPFNNCRFDADKPPINVATVDFYIDIDPSDPPDDSLRESLQDALDEVPWLMVAVTSDDDPSIGARFFNLNFHLSEFTGSVLNLARRLRKAAKVVSAWRRGLVDEKRPKWPTAS